jgi:hypothetical protein
MKDPELLSSSLAKLCLSGEGQGAVNFQGQQHTFTFEGLWDRDELVWGIAVAIPFHGEEIVRLNLQALTSEGGGEVISGGGYHKLRKELSHPEARYLIKQLKDQLRYWAVVIHLADQFKAKARSSLLNCTPVVLLDRQVRQSCLFGAKDKGRFNWRMEQEGELILTSGPKSEGDNYHGVITASDVKFGRYTQLGFKSHSQRPRGKGSLLWDLRLQFSSCH